VLLGRPLLALLYQRGEFDAAATEGVYQALRMYALGLAGHSCLELAARAYFAEKDTVTPLLLAAGSAILNILLSLVLMAPLSYAGLALANSIAITLEVVALLLILRSRWGGVEGRETMAQLARVLGATAIMSLAIVGASAVSDRSGMGSLLTLATAGTAGIAVYAGASVVLRIRELGRFATAVLGR